MKREKLFVPELLSRNSVSYMYASANSDSFLSTIYHSNTFMTQVIFILKGEGN